MAKKLKIRNDDDVTIFEMKLDDNSQNEKIKPGKVFLRLFLIIAVIAVSLAVGYFLHNLMG